MDSRQPPPHADAALVLEDGAVFWGRGIGARTDLAAVGEVCFNTSITGYQEILTAPSYAGQIVTFSAPHIGNVGTNPEDLESAVPACRGLVLREDPTQPSSWRAMEPLDAWLEERGVTGITGVDTRRLTRRIRDQGAPRGALCFPSPGQPLDVAALRAAAADWAGLEGMDLAIEVTTRAPYEWTQTRWVQGMGSGAVTSPRFHVVAIDYGVKHNILRCLASEGCRVTVMPATATAEEILATAPDGIFLSNGPGDPAATGVYAVPILQGLIASGIPIFGICLGHQILGLALGGRTSKLHLGHRGANHPVLDLATRRVEITSQNHGFAVEADSLPEGVAVTHVSLFDRTVEGLAVTGRPIFSVQYHPEASPGPHDSAPLFHRFAREMARHAAP